MRLAFWLVIAASAGPQCKKKAKKEYDTHLVQPLNLPGCRPKADLQELFLELQDFAYSGLETPFEARQMLADFSNNDIANSMYHDIVPGLAGYIMHAQDNEIGFAERRDDSSD